MISLTIMKRFYVPYSGNQPAAVLINGHRMLILANSRETLEEDLAFFGADQVRQVQAGDSASEAQLVLGRLASSAKGGVVVAPSDVGLRDVIRNLESELPWLQ